MRLLFEAAVLYLVQHCCAQPKITKIDEWLSNLTLKHSIIQLQLCTCPWLLRPHVYGAQGALMLTKTNSCSPEKNKRYFLGLPCDQVLLQYEPLAVEESLQSGHKEKTKQKNCYLVPCSNEGSINKSCFDCKHVSNFSFLLKKNKQLFVQMQNIETLISIHHEKIILLS